MGQRPPVDEQLWIRTGRCDGRDHLTGSCHTFPGRMSAYCPTKDVSFCVSLSDIEEMSPESERWVRGFLVGNEPRPEDMFGPAINDADDDDPRWARWREAVLDFRATGAWPHEAWSHLIAFPPGIELPPFVWALRGDEIWSWHGDSWIRADPQQRRTSRLLDGTVCSDRGHCAMTAVTTAHVVCDDCGSTSHVIPSGFTTEDWQHAQLTIRASPL